MVEQLGSSPILSFKRQIFFSTSKNDSFPICRWNACNIMCQRKDTAKLLRASNSLQQNGINHGADPLPSTLRHANCSVADLMENILLKAWKESKIKFPSAPGSVNYQQIYLLYLALILQFSEGVWNKQMRWHSFLFHLKGQHMFLLEKIKSSTWSWLKIQPATSIRSMGSSFQYPKPF